MNSKVAPVQNDLYRSCKLNPQIFAIMLVPCSCHFCTASTPLSIKLRAKHKADAVPHELKLS